MVIDRFEGAYAVCELPDQTFVHINRQLIDDSAAEGDVLQQAGNRFVVDQPTTAVQKERVQQKMAALFNRQK